ncbi:MAG: type II toxin-antitoxin system Phd/YefM family antitoxin [Spirochaetaceae bacterium]|nr:MAG: type II toxin-antitoxin system Phd/YefM family antitoxin [Spirochaetaceae bacterium]
MLMINIHDAKTNLSKYLSQLDREEEIVLCKRNRPVAVIRPLPSPRTRRVIGLERGRLNVPEGFFDALPEELVALYDGQDS